MKTILLIIFYFLMSLSAMYLLSYIPRIKGWFTSFKKQKRLYSNKFNKIAVIIPARNESAVIEDLLLSLENQTYPKEYFTTHIVIKDDNDKTITIAEKYNAIIHIAKDQTCKGDALNLCLKEIMSLETEYDYYVIIDADCMLHKEFLTEMKSGCSTFNRLRTENREHLIEKIGQEIRSSFVWGTNNKIIDRNKN